MPALTIAVSSRALFNVEDGHKIFETLGQDAFDAYQIENEHKPMRPGVAFAIVKKLLALNKPGKDKMVEVALLSRNSPNGSLRVIKSIEHHKLDIEKATFTSGGNRFSYAKALGASLFLSADPIDARHAIDNGLAAAALLPHSVIHPGSDGEIRIAFDGDSVLFSDEAERVNHMEGLIAFKKHERDNASVPLGAGPFKDFLQSLHKIQNQFKKGESPLKIALVTARGRSSSERVVTTLRNWGIDIDESVFCDGTNKGPILDAFGADIFFDDSPRNCSMSANHVSTGHVPSGISNEHGRPDAFENPVNPPKLSKNFDEDHTQFWRETREHIGLAASNEGGASQVRAPRLRIKLR